MAKMDNGVSVKQVGANGQISLGKKYAGRHVVIDDLGDGVWMVRTASIIPDNERWLDDPVARRDLEEAMEWAARTPADSSTTEAVLARLEDACK